MGVFNLERTMKTQCDSCYLSIFNRSTPDRAGGWSPTSTKSILFIGDSAGMVDCNNQTIFEGRVTKIVTEYINKYKLNSWSNKTFLIKCYCIEPTEHYADKCYNHIINIIQKTKPSIIVPIGSFVYKFLKDAKSVSMVKVVNKPIKYNNSILLPIYSPAYIIKTKEFEEYDKSFKLISDMFADICKEYRWIKPIFDYE